MGTNEKAFSFTPSAVQTFCVTVTRYFRALAVERKFPSAARPRRGLDVCSMPPGPELVEVRGKTPNRRKSLKLREAEARFGCSVYHIGGSICQDKSPC